MAKLDPETKTMNDFADILLARASIIQHIQDKKGVHGVIDCPVCKKGKLRFTRAACNGHIHASCSTEDCVRWME